MIDEPLNPNDGALVWCRPEQAALAREAAALAGLRVLAAGSPDPTRAGQVANELDAPAADDLRAALASTDARVALIADPGSFGEGASDEDAGAVSAARARGARLVALEPFPPSATDLAGSPWLEPQAGGRPVDAVRLATLPRRTRAWAAAAEALESFGVARSVSVEVRSPALAGSLGAALVGALDLVSGVLGEVESIDAALVEAARAGGVRESVRDLAGSLAALVRTPDGRAASVHATDRAGAWAFGATLAGEAGTLRVTHAGFVWTGTDGATLDEHRVPGVPEPAAVAPWVIAARIARLIDPAEPEPAPDQLPETLALAQAALLSARTGQPESPATIQRLVVR